MNSGLESNDLFRLLVLKADIGILVCDSSCTIRLANPTLLSWLKMSEKDLEGTSCRDGFPLEDYKDGPPFKPSRSYHRETLLHRRNGEPIPVDAFGRWLRLNDEQLSVDWISDNSRLASLRQREQEVELEKGNQFAIANKMIDGTREAVLLVDRRGRLRRINTTASRLLRLPRNPTRRIELDDVFDLSRLNPVPTMFSSEHELPLQRGGMVQVRIEPLGAGRPTLWWIQTPDKKEQRYRAEGRDEKRMIQEALQESGGVITQTAQLLGMNRSTLWRKMRKLGLDKSEGKSKG